MSDKEKKQPDKEPIEMTTDEALDYVFGEELSAELKAEVRRIDDPDCEQNGSN